MIASMLPPFLLGLGGRVGTGTQPLPWIHADDIVGLIRFGIDTTTINRAVFNGVAPQIITNAEFTKVSLIFEILLDVYKSVSVLLR